MSTTVSAMRWIRGILRRKRRNSHKDELQQCSVCSQFGVPNFHSTSCDPTHQPAWEALAGSSIKSGDEKQRSELIPGVVDPRSERVRWWSRVVLVARIASLAVDPFFFLAFGMGGGPCLYVDERMVRAVSFVRTCIDGMHLCHVWLEFRLAYVSRKSLVVGSGALVWNARDIAFHYLRSLRGFWLDAFVLLPIPQVYYLFVVPRLLREEKISILMKLTQVVFMCQYIPKVYHFYCLIMHRTQLVTGYVFGSIWWRFTLSYFFHILASHSAGGYWYALAIQRVVSCLTKECDANKKCSTLFLSCTSTVNPRFNSSCLDEDGSFPYGIYSFAVPVISYDSVATRILYANLWGVTSVSTMGNVLEPTCEIQETIFSCYMVLIGILLFTVMMGNIQVFLGAVMGRNTKNQVKFRDMEWWMKRRQVPPDLRKRVRHYENQSWSVMGGQDDMEIIKDLPDGLRRDIKRYLCLDLIKKVPFFKFLDDVILDNICDRLTYFVYSKGEKIIIEGDPVQRMVFIIHGRVRRSQCLSRGKVTHSILEPGSFFGDELLSWCIRTPVLNSYPSATASFTAVYPIYRYPAATATFTCVKPTEGFALEVNDLRYITNHFRYMFGKEKIKRAARYYSSNWRTWAAVNIQLAWWRYVLRTKRVVAVYRASSGHRLRHYAAIFMSFRPHDYLE